MNRFLMAISLLLVASCAVTEVDFEQALIDKAKKRASFDFGCKIEELNVTKIDDRTFGVEGCKRKSTYLVRGQQCQRQLLNGKEAVEKFCSMELNTDIKSSK